MVRTEGLSNTRTRHCGVQEHACEGFKWGTGPSVAYKNLSAAHCLQMFKCGGMRVMGHICAQGSAMCEELWRQYSGCKTLRHERGFLWECLRACVNRRVWLLLLIKCAFETNLNIERVGHQFGQIPSESLRSAGFCSKQDGGLLSSGQNFSHKISSKMNCSVERTEHNRKNLRIYLKIMSNALTGMTRNERLNGGGVCDTIAALN